MFAIETCQKISLDIAMAEDKNPYVKLDEIREVEDIKEANDLLAHDGWVYLGFFARTIVPDFGESHDKAYQTGVVILGKPSTFQNL